MSVAVGQRRRHVLLDTGQVVQPGRCRVEGKPEVAQPAHRSPVPVERRTSLQVADLIHPDRQTPRGGHRRILLAHRAGGGIAGIDEGGLARLLLSLIELIEGRQWHVDLAADLDEAGCFAAQPEGNGVDGLDVGGDVLADLPVASSGRLDV